MTRFIDTPAAEAWIATGPSRETCDEVMRAIATLTANEDDAEMAWSEGFSAAMGPSRFQRAVYMHCTRNGTQNINAPFPWGASGDTWSEPYYEEIEDALAEEDNW